MADKEAALVVLLQNLMQAEAAFRETFRIATEGPLPALTAVDLGAFAHNDPVPRLLWMAGQNDSAAPRRVLAAAGAEAVSCRDWWMLADLFASGHLRAAPNLIANRSFDNVSKDFQEPKFLYAKWGQLPAQWAITAMPTETGRVALVADAAMNDRRVLRIEGAWDTQVYQWIPVEPDCLYLATAQVRGTAAPGNDSALYLTFLDQAGKLVGPARMQALPKGMTGEWRSLAVAAQAPEAAAWVGVGMGVTRQQPGDALEVAAVALQGVIGEGTP